MVILLWQVAKVLKWYSTLFCQDSQLTTLQTLYMTTPAKQLLFFCLLCNEEGKANAIIDGTSFSLPDDTIPNELSKCKHEEVSKLLYTHDRVMDVDSEPKKRRRRRRGRRGGGRWQENASCIRCILMFRVLRGTSACPRNLILWAISMRPLSSKISINSVVKSSSPKSSGPSSVSMKVKQG